MTPTEQGSIELPQHRGRRLSGVAITVGAMLMASIATAQTKTANKQTADRLFEQGKQALAREDWAGACEKFQQSQNLDPSASTMVKLARCREHEGRPKAALDLYSEALALLRASERQDAHTRDLTDLIRTALERLDAELGHLNIHWTPGNVKATITVDGQPIAASTMSGASLVEPGQHQLTLHAAGYRSESLQLELAKGETRNIEFELKHDAIEVPTTPTPPAPSATAPITMPPSRQTSPPSRLTQPAAGVAAQPNAIVSPGSAPSSSKATRPKTPSSGRAQRVVAFVAGGAGSAMLGVAAYLGWRTRSLVDDARAGHCDSSRSTYECDPDGMAKLDDAGRKQTQAIVLAVGGTLLLGTGIVLLATTPSAPRQTARAKLTFILGPATAGLGGSF